MIDLYGIVSIPFLKNQRLPGVSGRCGTVWKKRKQKTRTG